MRTIILFLLILPLALFAGDPVTFSPEKPVIGEQLTVYYDPAAEQAVLRDPDSIDLYMLYWYTDDNPVFHSHTMKKSDDKWMTSLQLDDNALRAVQFKFRSGEHTDNNNDVFWDFPLHDDDGNVVPDGYYSLGRSWVPLMVAPGPGLEMFREMKPEKAEKYFAKEFERNPDHYKAGNDYLMTLNWQLRDADDPDELKERGLKVAQQLYERFPDNPDVLSSLVRAFSTFGDVETGTAIRKYIEENLPDHDFIISQKAIEILQARDDEERSIELAKNFLEQFPEAEQTDQIVNMVLLPNLVTSGKYNEAIQWLQDFEKPTPAMYWHLANTMLREEVDPAKIVPVARKAHTLFKEHPPVEKPTYVTSHDWEKRKNSFIQMELGLPAHFFHHTYATALWRNGEIEPSLVYIQSAYDMTDGEDPRTNTRYVEILHSAEQYEKALEAGRKAIVDNQAEEELIEQLAETFAVIHETDEGFDEFIEEARGETVISLREKFAGQMIEEPAPDFTLDKLDGKPVSLSDHEGKVVVIDFWATWCGPCISAFPHFQRVVEHFEDNPDVVFLAINTWEGDYDEERIEKVRSFIEENEYTFTVLFDEDTVVSEYGVQGIPTRFTLDRDGVIRFEDRGFSGPGMYNDMVVQIEMLLEGYEPLTER